MRLRQRKYEQSAKGKATHARYAATPKGIAVRKKKEHRYLSSPDGRIMRRLLESSPGRRFRQKLARQRSIFGH